jgi:hypothetical protein
MTKLNSTDVSINRTGSGSIDYRYYENRARDIRGTEVVKSMKSLFSGKKNS